MKSTQQLLPESHIQVQENVPDWQEAIKIASAPLLSEKIITKEYVAQMIRSVTENGPYMVLTDYFALMHARPGKSVKQQGMSLLVTKNAIDLVGKPVKIFLVLAATDNQSHLESLKKVMSIFMDEKKYQTILKGTKQEITQLFR